MFEETLVRTLRVCFLLLKITASICMIVLLLALVYTLLFTHCSAHDSTLYSTSPKVEVLQ